MECKYQECIKYHKLDLLWILLYMLHASSDNIPKGCILSYKSHKLYNKQVFNTLKMQEKGSQHKEIETKYVHIGFTKNVEEGDPSPLRLQVMEES